MRTHLLRSVVLTLILLVAVGVIYPLAGWGLSQVAFHAQANGSIVDGGAGSSLIGQPWTTASGAIDPRWFQGRPDPDNPLMLNGTAGESGAANLGPRSKTLVADVAALVKAWQAQGVQPTEDLVTTSASGLDPDITPADAYVQVPMVARARGIAPSVLRALIAAHTSGAELGFLGAPYVNVLGLNEALAALAGQRG